MAATIEARGGAGARRTFLDWPPDEPGRRPGTAAGPASKRPTPSAGARRAPAADRRAPRRLPGRRPGRRGRSCPPMMVERHVPAATIARLRPAGVRLHRRALRCERRRPPRRARDRRAGARAAPRTPRTGAARRRAGGRARGHAPTPPPGPSPESLTVVVLRSAHVGAATRLLDPGRSGSPVTSRPTSPHGGSTSSSFPERLAAARALLDALSGRGAVAGPTRPWHDAQRLVPARPAHARPRAARGGRRDRHRGAPRRARPRRRSRRPASTSGPAPSHRCPTSARRRRRGCTRRSAPGCSTRAGVSSSPPSSTSTPRPCATG